MNFPDPTRRPSFIVTLGMLTAAAAVTVDLSLPAVPDMVAALATTLPRGQQIVGVFMIGMACGQIPSGLLADRLGRMPVLYGGMGLFAVAAIGAALATSIDQLLVARFAQGVGAASALVLSRAIVRDIAHGKEAARLMSLMTMLFTAAPVVAPSIGALLVAQGGWRAPFATIAVLGVVLLLAIRVNLFETHEPNVDGHPVNQLVRSVREFFSHRQSIFGWLLIILPPAGYLSIIAVAAALCVEIYGFSITSFGLLFALFGISILSGALVNRLLVTRFDSLQLIAVGIGLGGASSALLLVFAWLDAAPFGLLWGAICVFMFSVALSMPNATVIALDPLPRIAGVASSILGTSQNIIGAAGAVVGALMFDGTVRNSVVIIGVAGMASLAIFLCRPLIAPGPLTHHPDELARD